LEGIAANDASLWEGAFVREFGDKEADAVRAATSVRQVRVPVFMSGAAVKTKAGAAAGAGAVDCVHT
jgi:hypothetical protein